MKAYEIYNVQNYWCGDLDIYLQQLTSLEGCPEKVTGNFDCRSNQITSFEHFPKYIDGHCYISVNPITCFKNIDQHIKCIHGWLIAYDLDITSGFSDLFFIEGLTKLILDDGVRNARKSIQLIINKYLPQKDIINFQDEIIKSGYESYL